MTVELVHAELNPHVHLWGWAVAIYLFLGGLAGGLLVFASWAHLARRRREYLPAVRVAQALTPPVILVGMFLLWLDLGGKWRPFWLYMTLRPTSPMSWGAWILLAVLLTSSLAAVPVYLARGRGMTGRSRDLGVGVPRTLRFLKGVEGWVGRRMNALAWANLVLGVSLGLYTGVLLGTMVARPVWNSPVLGPLFLASGMSAAAALLMLLAAHGPWVPLLVRAEAGLHATKVALVGLYLAGLATSGAGPQTAAALLVRGFWALPFWLLVVGGGILVPLAVATRELVVHRCPRPWVIASCTLTLVGGLALRVVLVFAGQAGL